MPTEVLSGLFYCGLFFGFAFLLGLPDFVRGAIKDWWHERKWREYRERAAAIRKDIGEGRYSRFPAQDVFDEMQELIVDLVAEVTHLSNELLQERHPGGCRGTVEEPIPLAETTVDGIWNRLVGQGQPNLVVVATVAFVLQETARQIDGLQQEGRFLSPVDFLSLLD